MVDSQPRPPGKPFRDETADTVSDRESPGENGPAEAGGPEDLSLGALLDSLSQDRLWLLRQLDSGRWPEWRLDLAALERELGQLIDQARERLEHD
jgi:hypothetical protein